MKINLISEADFGFLHIELLKLINGHRGEMIFNVHSHKDFQKHSYLRLAYKMVSHLKLFPDSQSNLANHLQIEQNMVDFIYAKLCNAKIINAKDIQYEN